MCYTQILCNSVFLICRNSFYIFGYEELLEMFYMIDHVKEKQALMVPKKMTKNYVLIAKGNVAMGFISWNFRRNSYLLSTIDEIIWRMHDVGLMAKFEEIFYVRPPIIETQEIQLKMHHFYGILLVCSVGYVLAILAFFVELIMGRWKRIISKRFKWYN